ncbi:MAG: hypothetical protein R3E01_30290 [Pirellulaceae bacterium]|nr:hypothetical protein [Planctomycetales bacterium]
MKMNQYVTSMEWAFVKRVLRSGYGLAAALSLAAAGGADASLVITGVIDGPLAGGVPKAVELYATTDIADLSFYGIGSANNGGGSAGQEFALAGSASSGQYLYVASESEGFVSFFGFSPTFTSSTASINGDDAIELFWNGGVIDVFGEIETDGTGQPWEYTDGWAYRKPMTGPDGSTFDLDNWTFSGINALDGTTSNSAAVNPFPVGTFSAVPEPSAFLFTGLACLLLGVRLGLSCFC